MEKVKWYALNCVSNREKEVSQKIMKKLSIEGHEEWVDDIRVPVEKILVNTGTRQNTRDKVSMPGYILIHADMSNGELLQTIRSVDGFIGFLTDNGISKKGKPIPMRESEVARFIKIIDKENENPRWEFKVGDKIKMLSGAFTTFEGNISDMNMKKESVTVLVNIFGRETSVDISIKDIEKV